MKFIRPASAIFLLLAVAACTTLSNRRDLYQPSTERSADKRPVVFTASAQPGLPPPPVVRSAPEEELPQGR